MRILVQNEFMNIGEVIKNEIREFIEKIVKSGKYKSISQAISHNLPKFTENYKILLMRVLRILKSYVLKVTLCLLLLNPLQTLKSKIKHISQNKELSKNSNNSNLQRRYEI